MEFTLTHTVRDNEKFTFCFVKTIKLLCKNHCNAISLHCVAFMAQ